MKGPNEERRSSRRRRPAVEPSVSPRASRHRSTGPQKVHREFRRGTLWPPRHASDSTISPTSRSGRILYEGQVEPGTYTLSVAAAGMGPSKREVHVPREGKTASIYLWVCAAGPRTATARTWFPSSRTTISSPSASKAAGHRHAWPGSMSQILPSSSRSHRSISKIPA